MNFAIDNESYIKLFLMLFSLGREFFLKVQIFSSLLEETLFPTSLMATEVISVSIVLVRR